MIQNAGNDAENVIIELQSIAIQKEQTSVKERMQELKDVAYNLN